MLNYIKSELYRLAHIRVWYITTLCLCGGVLLLNLALHFWGGGTEWYGHTSFSYSFFLGAPSFITMIAAVVGALLVENHRKTGALKNTLAVGLSRGQVFLGQCLTGILAASLMLACVLVCYILSAELLLAHSDPWAFGDVLRVAALVYLLACANLITMLLCIQLVKSDILAGIVWGAIWITLPIAIRTGGIRFSLLADLSTWLPYYFLQISGDTAWWSDPLLIEKCLVSGVIGVLVFTLAGVVLLRKRDL